MDSRLQRKHPYKSNLTGWTMANSETFPTKTPSIYKQKKADLLQQQQHRQHFLSSPTNGMQLYGRHQQGGLKMHTEDNDLDSDYELDNAPIQSASRVTRLLPVTISFLSTSTSLSTTTAPSNRTKKNSSHRKLDTSSPFYSTVIEPQMNLGQHWPTRFNTFKKVVQGDKWHTAMANKTTKVSMLKRMTAQLVNTYENQNPEYKYRSANQPKRLLTKPNKAAKNDGFDNDDYDYILKVGDILGEEKEYQYRVIDLLGKGTFGQVAKCERITTGELVSVKVIKNKVAYREQSRMEVEILKQLKKKLDYKGKEHILTLHHTFTYRNHFCLVFELLSFNLYELIKQNQFKGLSINLVRVFTLQLLDTLILLKEAKIIHCDLKPENVLLTSFDTPIIKVIDFGSACHEANKIYTYIQSRFYRSPEVLLGIQYTGAIDMWSLGCIVAELFIGIPLFPGSSEYNQLRRIIDMMGMPPQDMLDKGLNSDEFFNKESKGNGKHVYTLKSLEQYGMEHKKTELPGKKYYSQTELSELILQTKSRHRLHENPKQDLEQRRSMIDFLHGLLELNPLKRWTPRQARYHPFVTGQPFIEPYNPNNLARKQEPATENQTSNSQLPTPASSSASAILDPAEPKPTTSSNQKSLEAHQSLGIVESTGTQQATRRLRAQSMNTPTVPNEMHDLVLDMQAHPITEHFTMDQQPGFGIQQTKQTRKHQKEIDRTEPKCKYRHSRSQGDLVGLLSPEKHRNTILQSNEATLDGGLQLLPSQQPTSKSTDTSNANDLQQRQQPTTPIDSSDTITSPLSSISRMVTNASNAKIQFRNGTTIGSSLTSHHSHNSEQLVDSALLLSSSRHKSRNQYSHKGETGSGLLVRQENNGFYGSNSISNGNHGATTTKQQATHGN